MRPKFIVPPELMALLMDEKPSESCKLPSMRAALFSNFPDKFLQESILPKLAQRGVEIESVLSPKSADSIGGKTVDVVLFMHEMASHNDDRMVREAARREGLPMICLSRKASSWEGKLPSVALAQVPTVAVVESSSVVETVKESGSIETVETETHIGDKAMPDNTIRSVPDKQIEGMLRCMMRMHGQKMKYEDMVPELRQYWVNGKLTSGAQLYSYLGNILRRADCPVFYAQWVAAGRPSPSGGSQQPQPMTMKKHTISKTKKTKGMRGMLEKDLEKVLQLIMDQRDKGRPYKDFLDAVKKHWPNGDGPKDADQLSKFSSSAAHSPRAPAWFKTWYNAQKTRSGVKDQVAQKTVLKPNDDAELARVYAEENETLKRRLSELEKCAPDAADHELFTVKTCLKEIFTSCQKLVSIGAIDASQAFRIALEYLDKL